MSSYSKDKHDFEKFLDFCQFMLGLNRSKVAMLFLDEEVENYLEPSEIERAQSQLADRWLGWHEVQP